MIKRAKHKTTCRTKSLSPGKTKATKALRLRKRRSRKPSKPLQPRSFRPNAAGIDIGATEIFVAVPEDRDAQPVRSFSTFTADLRQAANWLKQCGIDTVAMESTGVYWLPVFQVLEQVGLEVCLVNARHVKNVPGRKTDVKDCQWLQYLHSVGLLEKSFRPPAAICAIRTLQRHRQSMVEMMNEHTQHLHKSLTQMNIQIHHVLSDITGQTGLRILDSILAGERDPKVLAALCDERIKASPQEVIKSLEGDYRPEHLFVLGQALAAYRFIATQVKQIDERVLQMAKALESFKPGAEQASLQNPRKFESAYDRTLAAETARAFGVDLTSIPCVSAWSAANLLAEIGPDVEAWKTEKHFVSWLALCPNNKISGGKILSSSTRRTPNRSKYIFRMCAYGATRSKSPIGDYFRKMRGRLGPAQAIVATAHKLARMVYHCIKTSQPYSEELLKRDAERAEIMRLQRLSRQAQQMGFILIPDIKKRRPIRRSKATTENARV